MRLLACALVGIVHTPTVLPVLYDGAVPHDAFRAVASHIIDIPARTGTTDAHADQAGSPPPPAGEHEGEFDATALRLCTPEVGARKLAIMQPRMAAGLLIEAPQTKTLEALLKLNRTAFDSIMRELHALGASIAEKTSKLPSWTDVAQPTPDNGASAPDESLEESRRRWPTTASRLLTALHPVPFLPHHWTSLPLTSTAT